MDKESWQSDVSYLQTLIRLNFERSGRLEKNKDSQVSFFYIPFWLQDSLQSNTALQKFLAIE